jgi:exopolysaccharide biosynthesis protein
MKKYLLRIAALGLLLLMLSQSVFAAAAPSVIQNIRYSQTATALRIVLDLSTVANYRVDTSTAGKIIVDLPNTTNQSAIPAVGFNDESVDSVKLETVDDTHQQLVISLKSMIVPKVFTLSGPNRLVIDLIKNSEHKIVTPIADGLIYTAWLRNQSFGPVSAYILDADLSKYNLTPVLSNGSIAGLESVTDMAEHNHALAAINGSYFALNGEIIGLLKLNNEIVSIPYITRTAVGITADNKLIFDQITYQGTIRLPDGRILAVNGVNCERSQDSVTLYNSYYGLSTGTNEFGKEYVITAGKVSAISPQNTPLHAGSIVLSAHGTAATVMATLKVGDSVSVEQSLGTAFDQVPYAIGAGPMLVKDGHVFVTATQEEFAPDIAAGRAPRTALGLTKTGHLLFVVIDGRKLNSKGLTLVELANFMQELGALQAMNFDGGGSSELVINGIVMNKPSDGKERRVGDALILTEKR